MLKAALHFLSISSSSNVADAADAQASNTDQHQLVSVALFGGIGLLVSLLAVMFGVQGAWF